MRTSNPRVAAKTLTRVEVDPKASNQHEFHAGTLRLLLGFDRTKVEGKLSLLVYGDDGQEPSLDDEGTFTLYDARERKPSREEWHLYYTSNLIGELARAGDLLVIVRPDEGLPDLQAVVARAGTRYEAQLRHLLDLGDASQVARFIRVEPATPDLQAAEELSLLRPAPAERPAADLLGSHPLLEAASRSGRVPRPKELAAAAHDLVLEELGGSDDADAFLLRALEVESELFFAIERALGERELQDLLRDGGGFTEVLRFAMSKHQSRKSRRGQSLQNHVEKLLELRDIPFEAQCRTEGSETPDFVIPGSREYHDPAFPSDGLRMVGCKSRLRERWRQYLTEAARIPVKYHVAVDEGLTDDLLRTMHAHDLRLFMPRAIVAAHYSSRETSALIGEISSLLDDLAHVTGAHRHSGGEPRAGM